MMKEKKSINVDELNNPEDFYCFLDNESLLDEDYYEGLYGRKLALRESVLIKRIENRQKALDRTRKFGKIDDILDRSRKIGEFDDSNDYIWWDIYDALEQGIDQAQYELETVQNYLARGIDEITPEVVYQEAIRKRRKIKIEYLKSISLTVALTLLFSIYAYIENPWLIILPILIGIIVILVQIISFDWEAATSYRNQLKNRK